MNTAETKQRDNWIDIAKVIGMYLIFIGHYGANIGTANNWVFSFHVPLFFFLSGLLENYNERGFIKNLIRKTATIAIPYLFFGAIYSVYLAISTNDLHAVKEYVILILKGGIRNSLDPGAGLWFLSCLYIVSIIFSVIKLVRNRFVIFIICFASFIASMFVINPGPTRMDPHWFWNIDSACHYIFFFCLGYLLLDPIKKISASEKKPVRISSMILLAICAVYSGLLFCGNDILAWIQDVNIVFVVIYAMIKPLISIYIVIYISSLLQNISVLCRIGQESLYLCGNESLIKLLVPVFLSIFGLEKHTDEPLQVYIYCTVLIILVYYLIIPLEKPILNKIKETLS